MIINTPLQAIDRGVCELINSQDGLWRKIGELARTMEYVLIEDPFKKLSCQLDVIEQHLGKSDKVRQLRSLISFQYQS